MKTVLILTMIAAPCFAQKSIKATPTVTPDMAARVQVQAASALYFATVPLVNSANEANGKAVAKCEAEAKAKTPAVELPKITDDKSVAAYIGACKAVGVELPFDVTRIDNVSKALASTETSMRNANMIRLMVKPPRETEEWRLPAVLEGLGFQVTALIAAIQDAHLGVKAEAIDEARKRFGR